MQNEVKKRYSHTNHNVYVLLCQYHSCSVKTVLQCYISTPSGISALPWWNVITAVNSTKQYSFLSTSKTSQKTGEWFTIMSANVLSLKCIIIRIIIIIILDCLKIYHKETVLKRLLPVWCEVTCGAHNVFSQAQRHIGNFDKNMSTIHPCYCIFSKCLQATPENITSH